MQPRRQVQILGSRGCETVHHDQTFNLTSLRLLRCRGYHRYHRHHRGGRPDHRYHGRTDR